jgi:hypothetical protein
MKQINLFITNGKVVTHGTDIDGAITFGITTLRI